MKEEYRDMLEALTYAIQSAFAEAKEKGPKCENCDKPMDEPYQTLHTEDWEYDFYNCPNCGHENIVF